MMACNMRGYFTDMEIVDNRLNKLEKDNAKIIELLNNILNDLSKIGGDNNGEQEELNESC